MDNIYIRALLGMFDLTQSWNVIFLAMILSVYVLYRHALVQGRNYEVEQKNKIRRLSGEKDLPNEATLFKTTWRVTKYASVAVVVLAFIVYNKFFPSS